LDGELARQANGWFRAAYLSNDTRPDPRASRAPSDAATARFDDAKAGKALTGWWSERVVRLVECGVSGFRCLSPHNVPQNAWRKIMDAARQESPDCMFLAWTPGLNWSQVSSLAGLDFGAVFSSVAWWDGRASWFVEESERLRRVAPIIACPEAPFGPRLAARIDPDGDVHGAYRHALRRAAATGDGLLVPMGFEYASARAMDSRHSTPADFSEAEAAHAFDLTADIRAANALIA